MLKRQEIGSKVKRGFGWVFMERILIRGIVFIRIPVLGFLLFPEDFGLMALITPILAFLDVITRTGFSTALIQKRGDVGDYWHVGWSMNLVKGIIQTILILLLMQPIAVFYNEPVLASMLLVIAGATLIKNATSIRMAALARAIDMRRVAIYNFTTDALGTAVTILLAYYYRNVWALVYGYFATMVFKTIGSYIAAPYKPRFDFSRDKMADLWSFSRWILVSGIFLTLFRNGDDILVGKVLGVTALGYYAMAYKMGNMVTTELVDALRKVLFPAFSFLQDDIPRLRTSFLISYAMTAALGFLFSLGLFLLASQLVHIFLPDKWLPIIPPLRILAIWGGLQMLSTSIAPLVNATGRPDRWAKLQMFKFSVMALTVYPLSIRWGIAGTAISVLLTATLEIPINTYWIRDSLHCNWWDVLKPTFIPIVTSLIVAVFYYAVNNIWQLPDLLHLLIFGGIITVFYSAVLLLFDWIFKAGYLGSIRRIIALS